MLTVKSAVRSIVHFILYHPCPDVTVCTLLGLASCTRVFLFFTENLDFDYPLIGLHPAHHHDHDRAIFIMDSDFTSPWHDDDASYVFDEFLNYHSPGAPGPSSSSSSFPDTKNESPPSRSSSRKRTAPSFFLDDVTACSPRSSSYSDSLTDGQSQNECDSSFGNSFPSVLDSAPLLPPQPQIPAPAPAPAPQPVLFIHPTSRKSRVETQILIKLMLYPLPLGVTKLRLPRHSVSKPKFFDKAETTRHPEILELSTNVVCTSAMQDQNALARAFARARGEPSVESNDASANSPLNGGDVKICAGCIQRERKRASRKKQRKPEEDELFQRDEDKRVVVFNTTELKDWVEPPNILGSPMNPPGAMQVELPMRIACYCRHQSEKLGFQVIFTIKDYRGQVVAQSITNSILITDDHKTHAPSTPPAPQQPMMPQANQANMSQFPSMGVFPTDASINMPSMTPSPFQSPFRLSHSAPDLVALRNHFPTGQMTPGMFSSGSTPMSATTPGSISSSASSSRHQSFSEHSAPSPKRRKPSAGNVPASLKMTKLDPQSSEQPQQQQPEATPPPLVPQPQPQPQLQSLPLPQPQPQPLPHPLQAQPRMHPETPPAPVSAAPTPTTTAPSTPSPAPPQAGAQPTSQFFPFSFAPQWSPSFMIPSSFIPMSFFGFNDQQQMAQSANDMMAFMGQQGQPQPQPQTQQPTQQQPPPPPLHPQTQGPEGVSPQDIMTGQPNESTDPNAAAPTQNDNASTNNDNSNNNNNNNNRTFVPPIPPSAIVVPGCAFALFWYFNNS